jgi:hypothetical protein
MKEERRIGTTGKPNEINTKRNKQTKDCAG